MYDEPRGSGRAVFLCPSPIIDGMTPMMRIHEFLRRGQHAAAEQLCAQWLQNHDDVDVRTLLGLSQLLGGAMERAAATYAQLTALQPGEASHWNNRGLALRQLGRDAEAAQAFEQALAIAPNHADAAYNLGTLAANAGDVVAAQDYFLHATRAAPARIESRLQAALMAFECGDNPLAEELLQHWRSWPLDDPDMLLDLGWLLGHLGHGEDGERLLRKAIATSAQPLRAQARLAMQLERANRLDAARELIAAMPAAADIDDATLRGEVLGAQAALALREREPARAQALLEALLAIPQADSARAATLFHLARCSDRAGDTQAAMQHLAQAHALQVPTAARLMPALAHTQAPPLVRAARRIEAPSFAAWPSISAPSAAQSPIFVVGFPRSGTTLLEAMLDSHPDLAAMDERPFLQDLIDAMQRAGYAYPEDLGRLGSEDAGQLREVYWRRVAATGRWRHGQRLVDKNPLNLLCLPMLKRLFPNAKIVLALRHPCDVMLSCYQQNFRSPAFALMCSTLERLAGGYRTAMDFWIEQSRLLRPDALELRYEDLVTDFATQTQRLAQFLELGDAKSMHRFHEHASAKGFISTPSYSAVVRPPDASRIARWQRYRPWFEPLLPELAPVLQHWGYDAA